jgi:hypothetical protein
VTFHPNVNKNSASIAKVRNKFIKELLNHQPEAHDDPDEEAKHEETKKSSKKEVKLP